MDGVTEIAEYRTFTGCKSDGGGTSGGDQYDFCFVTPTGDSIWFTGPFSDRPKYLDRAATYTISGRVVSADRVNGFTAPDFESIWLADARVEKE